MSAGLSELPFLPSREWKLVLYFPKFFCDFHADLQTGERHKPRVLSQLMERLSSSILPSCLVRQKKGLRTRHGVLGFLSIMKLGYRGEEGYLGCADGMELLLRCHVQVLNKTQEIRSAFVSSAASTRMCFLGIILSWSFCFSDVLCPNVHVEGDRFKHTNGGTDEIPGKQTLVLLSLWELK